MNEVLSALKAIVDGLPSEYDDQHTLNLIERGQRAIDNYYDEQKDFQR